MITEVILGSGESLTRAEILEGFFRFAQADASFPLMGAHDVHMALYAMLLAVTEFAENEDLL